jgi:DNA-binding NtrC family response regulator
MCCFPHMPEQTTGSLSSVMMRYKNPRAVLLLLVGHTALKEAMKAILLQVDAILVKPMSIPEMVALIHDRLDKLASRRPSKTERMAFILERGAQANIANCRCAVLGRNRHRKALSCRAESVARRVAR